MFIRTHFASTVADRVGLVKVSAIEVMFISFKQIESYVTLEHKTFHRSLLIFFNWESYIIWKLNKKGFLLGLENIWLRYNYLKLWGCKNFKIEKITFEVVHQRCCSRTYRFASLGLSVVLYWRWSKWTRKLKFIKSWQQRAKIGCVFPALFVCVFAASTHQNKILIKEIS